MIVALAIAFSQAAQPGPTLPAGVDPEFQAVCIRIEQKLEKEDFAGAASLMKLLPGKNVTLGWDDSKVPTAARAEFAAARDAAIKEWNRVMVESNTIKVVQGKGDLQVQFEPVLAVSSTSNMPSGSAAFFSDSAQSRMEFVIGLKRGNPLMTTDADSVYNELMYGIGLYFGVAQTPNVGFAMGKTDLDLSYRIKIHPTEMRVAQQNAEAVRLLERAISKKTRMTPVAPAFKADPLQIDAGSALQGKPIDLNIQVTNIGTGTLNVRLMPDCGCIATDPSKAVEASSTGMFRIRIDTTEFAGELNKNIYVYSNDTERPVFRIPIKAFSKPRYRFLSQESSVVLLPDGGKTVDLFLVTPSDSPLQIVQAEIAGLDADVTYQPWKGTLPDPELNEGPKPRQGHRLSVKIRAPLVGGRSPGTVTILTTDPVFKELRHTIYVQKGIVSMPEQLYWGELGSGPRRGTVLISRPGAPFKILGVTSDLPYFETTVSNSRESWEYRLGIAYDGKAPKGELKATIKVKTDDPKQPTITIPVTGIVR